MARHDHNRQLDDMPTRPGGFQDPVAFMDIYFLRESDVLDRHWFLPDLPFGKETHSFRIFGGKIDSGLANSACSKSPLNQAVSEKVNV
jgi:hypothetical protein